MKTCQVSNKLFLSPHEVNERRQNKTPHPVACAGTICNPVRQGWGVALVQFDHHPAHAVLSQPRVAELFEVRKPKEVAVLSEIDGYVSISKATKKGKQRVTITPVDVGDKKEYLIPRGKHINVYEGDYVRAGEPLIGGAANPQDILKIKGEVALAKYLVDEVQEVYRLQGVRINDKHIEVIVRQMMRRVKIVDVGDTDFILEEQVDKITFEETNEAIISKGGMPAVAEPLILGITKASLSTDSFISAASFQETTKVLTDASIAGAEDNLRGLKENVIMGRIIPAGTGVVHYHDLSVSASESR